MCDQSAQLLDRFLEPRRVPLVELDDLHEGCCSVVSVDEVQQVVLHVVRLDGHDVQPVP